ncbi:MAG TPA: DinB family protein [Anaerolineae bacterium]|nr:DinB family protein [Anaerolineae bacterium]
MSAQHWTRRDLLESLDTVWVEYPRRLQQLPDDEQLRFAQQQGYARPQDLLAHLGAWMEEAVRVMPYLQRDERPPRDYSGDDEFNARAVQRFADRPRREVEAWYEQQRLALQQLVAQLSAEDLQQQRVYRWLVGTIAEHYEEHSLPA